MLLSLTLIFNTSSSKKYKFTFKNNKKSHLQLVLFSNSLKEKNHKKHKL